MRFCRSESSTVRPPPRLWRTLTCRPITVAVRPARRLTRNTQQKPHVCASTVWCSLLRSARSKIAFMRPIPAATLDNGASSGHGALRHSPSVGLESASLVEVCKENKKNHRGEICYLWIYPQEILYLQNCNQIFKNILSYVSPGTLFLGSQFNSKDYLKDKCAALELCCQ